MLRLNALTGFGAGRSGYKIPYSLRFNDDDSAYLSRTPASAGNRKTWTWSGWVKRGNLGTYQRLLSVSSPSDEHILLRNVDGLHFGSAGAAFEIRADDVKLRDPSAWYHLMIVVDTTNGTSSDRLRMYVNGARVTSFSTATYPALNAETGINGAVAHNIGRQDTDAQYLDGLLSDVNFIDGQALDASYFGKTDPVTGAWVPKKYSGSYGTNGFYLDFKDGTSTTTLGYDRSGNGNNWTLNNLATSDQLTDTPTNNYCALSSIAKNSNIVLYDYNLGKSDGSQGNVWGTFGVTTGKWYFEAKIRQAASDSNSVGIVDLKQATLTSPSYIGDSAWGWAMCSDLGTDTRVRNGGVTGTYTPAISGYTQICMIAFDADAGKVWFGLDGTWFNSGNPAAGTGAVYTNLTAGGAFAPAFSGLAGNNPGFELRARNQEFTHTPPTGFKSLCTDNLPVPSIKKPSTAFAVATALGSSIESSVAALRSGWGSYIEDFKDRSAVQSWKRRLSSDTANMTSSDSTAAETAFTTPTSGDSYVGYVQRVGAAYGMNYSDAVSHTNGVATTWAHGLGVAPAMVELKMLNGASNWFVYHKELTAGNLLYKNLTNAQGADSTITVDSTNVTIAAGTASGTYLVVAYAEVAGFSRIGSYTGNGSADGPFVWCGFRPKYVLAKRIDVADHWVILDSTRKTYNYIEGALHPHLTNAEVNPDATTAMDFLANGFKWRYNNSYNVSGGTYIFIAFAEHPFKYARAA